MVSFAGTSLGGIGPNRRLFGQLGEADHLTYLTRVRFYQGQPNEGAHLADHLEQLIQLHDASNIARLLWNPYLASRSNYHH